MGNARQPTRKGRYILRAAIFVILSVGVAARISGESIGRSAKPSNGLIAFADARDQKQLTDEPAPASSDNPTWSPDGKSILFDTQRRKRPEIWVMNSDGSDERVLVSDVKVIPMRTSWQPVFLVESFNKPDSSLTAALFWDIPSISY